MKKLFVIALVVLCLVPVPSQAELKPVRLICRGANIPAHVKLLRQAVRAKLDAAQISYRSVNVQVRRIKRSKGVLATDYSADLTLSGGSTPTVTFGGSFPAPEACSVSAKLLIMVNYEAGRTVTFTDITVPGVMLFSKPVKSLDDSSTLD